MGDTEFSLWIEKTYEELIDRFVAADGRLTDREYDEMMVLKSVSKQLMKLSDLPEKLENLKAIAEFNRNKEK